MSYHLIADKETEWTIKEDGSLVFGWRLGALLGSSGPITDYMKRRRSFDTFHSLDDFLLLIYIQDYQETITSTVWALAKESWMALRLA